MSKSMQNGATAFRPGFAAEVREGVRVFANLACILDKVEAEGTLDDLARLFERIFEREINFTVKGELTRTQPAAARLAPSPLRLRTLPQQRQLPKEPGTDRRGSRLAHQWRPRGRPK